MQTVGVHCIPTQSPDDVSGLQRAIESGDIVPEEIICVLGKTEGNGCVNDFTRGYATLAYKLFLAQKLGISMEEVAKRVAFIMSGGTEGVMTPHITVFTQSFHEGDVSQEKRLAAGVSFTRDFLPEEIGTIVQVQEVADAVREAMKIAQIESISDVHFVQLKCPLLTADRIEDAHRRGKDVVVNDTYKSMGFSRGASALGVAVALGELAADVITDEVICKDWSLMSSVASTSAGVELEKCEIILLGNSSASSSDLVISHDVMVDALDRHAVIRALEVLDIHPDDEGAVSRVVNVFAKAEASSTGTIRGRRHVMLDDSDINHTRHIRAVVNAVIASLVGDPMVYISGGAEHQGPDGGGPVAVIART